MRVHADVGRPTTLAKLTFASKSIVTSLWMGYTATSIEKVLKLLLQQDRDLLQQEEQIRKQRKGVTEQTRELEAALQYIISCGAQEMKVTRRLENLV